MSSLADQMKTHIYHRQAKGATWAELLMLFDAWCLAFDAHNAPALSLALAVPEGGRQIIEGFGLRYGGTAHQILMVCPPTPMGVGQLHERYRGRWQTSISDDNIRTTLHRLSQNDFLERVGYGMYALTPVGQALLHKLDISAPSFAISATSFADEAATLIRSLLDGTYQPQPGEYVAPFSSEALDRALELLEAE